MTGFVSLLGAGPGDPELLTRKALDRLARADLVLYDALVCPVVLDLAPRAQRFFVGKRAGRHAIRQETIHHLMIRGARRGRRVVRLKSGDPFLFGRGGEEALALQAAGIPFEVVPGVSSALAAPALAGIPVTHRGLSSALTIVSGHAESAYRPVLESLAPHSATVVVLMALASRASVARLLLVRGWAPHTPAAILLAASTPQAFTWTGTISDLGTVLLPADRGHGAGTLVIGEVVGMADRLALPRVGSVVVAPAPSARRASWPQ
jgi:uroporphyrin-III C-methyltransferase / precorrin-2 dehydrogenase / sirohydrochlorin ferrochelatase